MTTSSMAKLVRVGLFGGSQGTLHEITEAPQRLASITVTSTKNGKGGKVIGFSFSYVDSSGKEITIKWGTVTGGIANTVVVPPTLHVIELSGTADGNVKSLTIVTDDEERYGPYGDSTEGKEFTIPVYKSAIIGFFGRDSKVGVNSIGAYVVPMPDNHP